MAVIHVGKLRAVSTSPTAMRRSVSILHVVRETIPDLHPDHSYLLAREKLVVRTSCGLVIGAELEREHSHKTRPCERCHAAFTGVLSYHLLGRAAEVGELWR